MTMGEAPLRMTMGEALLRMTIRGEDPQNANGEHSSE